MRSLLTAIVLLQVTAAPVPTTLVSASNPRTQGIDAQTVLIEVDIVNATNLSPTAWRVALSFKYSDGRDGSRAVIRDAYKAVAGVGPRGTVFAPRGSVREVFHIQAPVGTTIAEPRAYVSWVVFDDGTWAGDATGIQEVFDRRQRESEGWTAVGRMLATARLQGGKAALESALVQLVDYVDKEPNEAIDAMRRTIDDYLKRGSNVTPDGFMAQWVIRANERARAAAAHAVRKERRTAK